MSLLAAVGECMIELSAAGDDLWRMGVAGDTLNTAWYARALLPESWSVEYVTRVGTDAFSDRAVQFLQQNAIGTSHITRHPTRGIGLYAIALVDGERSFTYWRDTSAARTLCDDLDPVVRALAAAAVIHVSGITLAILPPEPRARLISLLVAQRKRGAICVFDPNYRPRLWPDGDSARDAITAAARACTILLPSFDDEAALFGDSTPEATLHRYADLGAGTIVVKNGGGDLMAMQDGARLTLTDLPQVTPVDTTGAGDAFNGAFLAAIAKGASLEAALRAAHATATQVVLHRGALLPLPMLT